MQSDQEQNEEQLRLATVRSLPSGAALDSETAAMRDDFLALGSALDAAAGTLNESALIAQLQESCKAPDHAAVLTPPQSNTTWQAVFSIALAAAALVAIVRIAAPLAVEVPTGKAVVARQETPQPSAIVRAPGDVEIAAPSRSSWFDPLDDEIALAQAEFQWLSTDSRGVDGSLSSMNERLEALSQELFQGSL
jgi:hypothetical protein